MSVHYYNNEYEYKWALLVFEQTFSFIKFDQSVVSESLLGNSRWI